jgi:hypothetical protein
MKRKSPKKPDDPGQKDPAHREKFEAARRTAHLEPRKNAEDSTNEPKLGSVGNEKIENTSPSAAFATRS